MVMPEVVSHAHTCVWSRRLAPAECQFRGIMIRNHKFRTMGMGLVASLGLASVLVLGGASVAAAQPPTTVSVSTSISGSGCTAGCPVTVTWAHAHKANAGSIVIVECNYNVYSGDTSACNQSPSNIDQPGGPWLPSPNKSNGSFSVELESGTVGDGTCDADQVCAVLLANAETMEPITGPTAFAVTP